MSKKIINVYCDESCHLMHDQSPVMSMGGIWCEKKETSAIFDQIRALKKKHGLPFSYEAKWNKISKRKLAFYTELVDLFFNTTHMGFRGVLVADKSKLDHKTYEQSHDDFYNKMYYLTLQWIIRQQNEYHIYLDIKDTIGGPRVKKLHDVLRKKFADPMGECISHIQQIHSHEVELMQIVDIFVGALCYANRKLRVDGPKVDVINRIAGYIPTHSLCQKTALSYRKFNLFIWEADYK